MKNLNEVAKDMQKASEGMKEVIEYVENLDPNSEAGRALFEAICEAFGK